MTARTNRLRIKRIADALEIGHKLDAEDRKLLLTALRQIADGADANEALQVKARRGERTSPASQEVATNTQLAMGWINSAILPLGEGGLGLTVEAAIATIGENGLHAFGLSEETLKTYRKRYPTMRSPDMHLDKADIDQWQKVRGKTRSARFDKTK